MPTEHRDPPSPAVRRDNLTPEQRRSLMGRIGPKGSVPEMEVRRACHALGYRFRLHRRDLPGTPDLTFPSRRRVVLVHGCFWHAHQGCAKGRRTPANEFWRAKLYRNVQRDGEVEERLRLAGWNVLVVWECQTRDRTTLADRLASFLGPPGRGRSADAACRT